MKNRRIGRFFVSRKMLDDRSSELAEMVYALKIVVVHAEMQYAVDAVEYIGISPAFDEIEPGPACSPPLYDITAETSPETPGKYKYTVTKR